VMRINRSQDVSDRLRVPQGNVGAEDGNDHPRTATLASFVSMRGRIVPRRPWAEVSRVQTSGLFTRPQSSRRPTRHVCATIDRVIWEPESHEHYPAGHVPRHTMAERGPSTIFICPAAAFISARSSS